MALDLSAAMRLQLAQVGISLDAAPTRLPAATPVHHEIDRVAIRDVLAKRGARARDLEWLTASCPSLADARRYVPPRDLTLTRSTDG